MSNKKPKSDRAGSTESPTCGCILICDDVIESKLRGKHILHGIVSAIRCAALPARVGPFVAYVRLSNVYKNTRLRFRFLDLGNDEDESTTFEFEVAVEGEPDPVGLYTLIIPLQAFEVIKPGKHLFQCVDVNGIEVASSPIFIHGSNSPKEE